MQSAWGVEHTEISKAGDWKTINQRELKAAGARKKQRRAGGVAITGAGVAGAGFARGGTLGQASTYARSLKQSAKLPGHFRRVNQAMGGTRVDQARAGLNGLRAAGNDAVTITRSNPRGAVIAGGAALAGAGAAGWAHQRGVEGYHQRKINQRRRARVKKALFPGQTLGAAKRAGSLVAKPAIGPKPAVNRVGVQAKMAGLPKPPSSQPRSPRSAQKVNTGTTMVKPVTPVKPIGGPAAPGGTSSFQAKRTMTPGAKLVAGGTVGGAAIGGGSLMNRRNK